MTSCERLSERMPAVALGRATWSDDEARHVASCDECATEWAIVQATGRLGRSYQPSFDPERLTRAALDRVAADAAAARRHRLWGIVGGLAAAATIAFFVWSGRAAPSGVVAPLAQAPGVSAPDTSPKSAAPAVPATEQFALQIPELESLDATELQAVLDAFDAPLSEGSTLDGPNLGDLDDHELERVLSSWEA